MRGIICTLLFTFIIFLNYSELWAMDVTLHFPLPRPRANRFAGFPRGATFLKNGKQAGFIEPKFGNFVIDHNGFTHEPLIEPSRAYLPNGAFVFRNSRLLGPLKNEEILGRYDNGWEVIYTPLDGDEVKDDQDRLLAIYTNRWRDARNHPAVH